MANLRYKISVLTVTYGNRWIFLNEVIKRVLSFDLVTDFIIVNNASDYDLDSKIKEFDDNRIRVINFNENMGSAGGYHAALKEANQYSEADFYFLLDDDNLPELNVIDRLIEAWEELNRQNSTTALYCMRDDRTAHIRIAQGEDPYRYYLVPNNFLGFNVFRIVYNQYQKFWDKLGGNKGELSFTKVPYVPYGGLFLPRNVVDKIGCPDQRFFLYVDDSEYSYRITAQGGVIWLVPGAEVKDIDKSQGVTYKKRWFASVLLDQWSFRTYYHVRNRLFFYTRVAVHNKFVFQINRFILMAWLKFISIIRAQQAQYKKLVVAVNDGLNGNLGKADPNKF